VSVAVRFRASFWWEAGACRFRRGGDVVGPGTEPTRTTRGIYTLDQQLNSTGVYEHNSGM
jgi:hypothetical protein